jgi:predicted nuclease with RNAse H fold
MRVAAIKAHMMMGTYARDPATGAGPDTPTAGSQVGGGVRSAGDSSGPAGSGAAMPHAFGIKDSSRAPASIGIDVAESRKGLDLVALDRERLIAAAGSRLTVDEVVETVVSLRPAVVCIDSPSGWSRSGRSRLAERQLARLGIQAYYTGQDPGDHPFYSWIRVGLQIFDRLAVEYPLYRSGEVAGHAAEIFPHASAALLANSLPARGQKEPFRRRVLRDHAVAEENLPTLDLVDAGLAALTGLIALDGRHSAVGDPDEGIILLPVRALQLTPLTKSGRSTSDPEGRVSPKGRSHSQGESVQIGYVNRNGQTVIAATDRPGTDHGRHIYVLRCGSCNHEYGSNGSDNFQRKCPKCQGGRPGLHHSGARPRAP